MHQIIYEGFTTMSSELKKAVADFIQALIALVMAIINNNGKALAGDVEAAPVKQAPAAKAEADTESEGEKVWPKNFSSFRKAWLKAGGKAESFAGAVFAGCSCVSFSPEKIDLIIMGAPEFESSAISPEGIAMVRAELDKHLPDFDGDLVIRTNAMGGATGAKGKKAKADATAPAASASVSETPAVTIVDLKKACVELAERIGDKAKVLELLKRFGSGKVADIPADKYPDVMNAIRNYGETTTASAPNAEDF